MMYEAERFENVKTGTVFGFQIHHLSQSAQFLIYSVAIFVFYLTYGYFQELIFQLEGFRPFGMYLTFFQFIMYSLFAAAERQVRQEPTRRIPLKTFALISFLTVATMGLSNSSVGYLNYPMQVVFKCCKLVPVLIGGILIQGKSYGFTDFIAATLMSCGLVLFTLTDSQISPNFNSIGVLMVMSALCADAAIGNVQEKAMKKYSASTVEVVYYSYLIGCAYLLIALLFLGQLLPAFRFCSVYPKETYGYGAIFSLTGYCGVQLVLKLVQISGAFATAVVTTCRKAVTIVLSFLLFSKPFTLQYVWSGLIVLAGIYLSIWAKSTPYSLQQFLVRVLSKSHARPNHVTTTV